MTEAEGQEHFSDLVHRYTAPLHDGLADLVSHVTIETGTGTTTSDDDGALAPLEMTHPLVGIESAYDDEHDDDDGHAAGAPGSASNVQVVVNIIISFVGAGLLGIPHAFAKAGWLLGSVAVIGVSALNLYSMLLLPQVKWKLRTKGHMDITSYGDLGRIILGPQGELLVNVCLGISQAGFATAYIIFIAANMYSMIGIPRWLMCGLAVPGLTYLVSKREMKQLAPFSMLANGANFAALLVVLIQDFKSISRPNLTSASFDEKDVSEDDTDTAVQIFQFSGLLYVVAITIYSLEGVGLILSLESSAKHPGMFAPLLRGTVCSITAFMAFFGTAGYVAFRANTMAPITLNLSSASGTFVKLALSLGLYLTYPIMMFPIWNIAERIYPDLKRNPKQGQNFRITIVCMSALVAFLVPDFGKFLSLVGSSICTILGLILPSFFHLKTFVDDSGESEQPQWQFRLNISLMVGGILFGILGTYQSFVAMLHGDLEGDVRRLHEHHLV